MSSGRTFCRDPELGDHQAVDQAFPDGQRNMAYDLEADPAVVLVAFLNKERLQVSPLQLLLVDRP